MAIAVLSAEAAAYSAAVIRVVVVKEIVDPLLLKIAATGSPGGGGGGDDGGDPTLSYGTNAGKGKTATNARRLRRNMEATGVNLKPEEAAHHIVPSTHSYPSARESREILHRYGIDINDAVNGVPLPDVLHDGLSNSHKYMDEVYNWLERANTGAEIEQTLTQIGHLLRAGKFP